VRALDGERAKEVRDLMNVLFERASSTSSDWSDPDRWIGEHLSGELAALAHRIWEKSERGINPRFLFQHHAFISRLQLLETVEGRYRLGERGQRFLAGNGDILRAFVALRTAKRGPTGKRLR
jgi:restriction system protein